MAQITEENITKHLTDNPCRGIVLGFSNKGIQTQISWIMGRSSNSQNRKYVIDEKLSVVKTQAFDESKVEDPRLIIYNAMKGFNPNNYSIFHQIVSNGDQTDTVCEYFIRANAERIIDGKMTDFSKLFFESLETRYCEPDAPTFTPRITGMQDLNSPYKLLLSVIKAEPKAKAHWIQTAKELSLNKESFRKPGITEQQITDAYNNAIDEQAKLNHFEFPSSRHNFVRYIQQGQGLCLTTYMPGSKELKSFEGNPILTPMNGTLDEIMKFYWNKLAPGPEGKWPVAIAGKQFTEDKIEYKVMNRLEG